MQGPHERPFQILQEAGILNDENRAAVEKYLMGDNPEELAQALIMLHESKILNEENRTALCNHSDPKDLAEAFLILHEAEILNKETRTALCNHQASINLAEAFVKLNDHYLLTAENLTAVCEYEYGEPGDLEDLAEALVTLHCDETNTESNRKEVIKLANSQMKCNFILRESLSNKILKVI